MKTSEILRNNQFHIKKKFGQNFLTSLDILNKIVDSGNVNKEIGVIEIGPGLGALTEVIASKAKKVLCYEIDNELIPILDENLREYSNITVLNCDVLKARINEDINKYLSDCKEIYVIANLPYYITTPILLHLLQTSTSISKYIVMMQLEVADRICGSKCTKDYNSLSIAIQYRASVRKLFKVPRSVFIPAPNVDSAVIEIKTYDEKVYKPISEAFFFEIVRNSFSQRRKTLINNLLFNYSSTREELNSILKEISIKENARSEELSIEDFVRLSDALFQKFKEVEELDIFDSEGNKTGRTMLRGEQLKNGDFLKIVLIVLKSADWYLIQKRSNNKTSYPGMWDIVGGMVLYNEEEKDAAFREVKEEMGVSLSDIKLVHFDKPDGKFIRYIYVAEIPLDTTVVIDKKEVSSYMWCKLPEIKNLVDDGRFLKRDYEIIIKYGI